MSLHESKATRAADSLSNAFSMHQSLFLHTTVSSQSDQDIVRHPLWFCREEMPDVVVAGLAAVLLGACLTGNPQVRR